jgi:predicted amidohydrolase YtcJ
MKMQKYLLNFTLSVIGGLTCNYSLAAIKADMVIHNAKVYTVDNQDTIAQAIAVKGNKIIYVGNDAGVDKHIGNYTKLFNARKRMVLPGLHDVHQHPLEAADDSLSCTLKYENNVTQNVALVKKCAKSTNGWILGSGHSLDSLLTADKDPATYLDTVSRTTPIAIMESTSHSMWVNSAALTRLGFDYNSQNPSGGVIVKGPSGNPTGLLLDTAGDMVLHHVKLNPSSKEKNTHYQNLLWSLNKLKKNGITSIANGRLYWKREYLDAWKKADNNETLTVRATMALWVYPENVNDDAQINTLKSMYSNDPRSFLRVNQIKMYSDGIGINTTAAMLEPYLIDYDLSFDSALGLNYFNEDRMAYYITNLEKKGFNMLIHAIGDRGVRESLNAIETAKEINGNINRTRRHHLTHVEYVNPSDIDRFYQLNVTADFQTAGDWTVAGQTLPEEIALMGEVRQSDHTPIRDIYNTGANVTLSSDWDVASLNPFVGMMHSLQRAHQSLPNIKEAIRAYTINAAYVLDQENRLGSIEVGKVADFAIINQDLLTVNTNKIGNTKTLMTILDGEVIYKKARVKW